MLTDDNYLTIDSATGVMLCVLECSYGAANTYVLHSFDNENCRIFAYNARLQSFFSEAVRCLVFKISLKKP